MRLMRQRVERLERMAAQKGGALPDYERALAAMTPEEIIRLHTEMLGTDADPDPEFERLCRLPVDVLLEMHREQLRAW